MALKVMCLRLLELHQVLGIDNGLSPSKRESEQRRGENGSSVDACPLARAPRASRLGGHYAPVARCFCKA